MTDFLDTVSFENIDADAQTARFRSDVVMRLVALLGQELTQVLIFLKRKLKFFKNIFFVFFFLERVLLKDLCLSINRIMCKSIKIKENAV